MSSTATTTASPGIHVSDQEALIEQHIPLVKFVLAKVSSRLPRWVDREDLLEAGMVGLLDALRKFDPERGVAFNTYAVTRIRGAMLDHIRSMDWLPRSMRDKIDRLRTASRELTLANDCHPSPLELAGALDLPLAEVHRLLFISNGYGPVSLDQPLHHEGAGGDLLRFQIAEEKAPTPYDHLVGCETRTIIEEAIAELPERERRVIMLHYYRSMRLREIARLLELSDTRIGQLRRQAIERMERYIRRRAPGAWT